jgi:HD-GYP domain-containing protein (c-di-GMP phosphodiesterase class II)
MALSAAKPARRSSMTVLTGKPEESTDAEGRFANVPVSRLRAGAKLRFPVYDDRADREVLLLAAGTKVTSSLVERLKQRGVQQVRVSLDDLQGMKSTAERSRKGPSDRQRTGNPAVPIRPATEFRKLLTPESFVHTVSRHGSSQYEAATARKFVKGYCESVRQVESLFTGLASGGMRDASEIAAVSSNSLVKITEDLDLFVRMGITPVTDKYPCKHSLQTAMLAMSVATVMGHKRNDLIELGIGCLVHDAGMLRLDAELLRMDKVLDGVQFLEITKHPTITFEMLKDLPDVPIGARFVAYQMHERCDGSGYPRKRVASQIHPFSKIAAVADVFVALLSPRPHRPGMLPYHAMEEILKGARRGLYDPAAVRALLHTVSLFPIGSCVRMNDGRVGRVVRSNREEFSRPVVEAWHPEMVEPQFELVDLSKASTLSITGVLAELPRPPEESQADLQFHADSWE